MKVYQNLAYDLIRRMMRDITVNKSDEYKAAYVQGIVDLQTEIFKYMANDQLVSTHAVIETIREHRKENSDEWMDMPFAVTPDTLIKEICKLPRGV